MDYSESTKVVFNRIQTLEPDHVAKIIGYLLLQEQGELEMIRLAFCPDFMIRSMIDWAKSELGLTRKPLFLSHVPSDLIPIHRFSSFTTQAAVSASPPPPPPPMSTRNGFWENHQKPNDLDLVQNGVQFLNMDDSLNDHSVNRSDYPGGFFCRDQALPEMTSLPDFPVKVSHHYNKGFRKHRMNCRHFHGQIMPERESFSQMPNPNEEEKHGFPLGSIEKLEDEITELLKSRKGSPISISSLPLMYYEKYGKTLQPESYLTDSQRHEKAGNSFTKLLARLKNSIRVIDRPHGQKSVILVEDRYENGGSRQIYLTFPAESSFTELDVSNYFCKFGSVRDVRIPCQQKRMFGFVTFVNSETVKRVLGKGSPHFICGARVLVKPYREKSRSIDRQYADKELQGMNCGSQFIETDAEVNSSVHEEQAERFSYLLDVLNSEPVPEEKVMTISSNNKGADR